MRLNPVQVPRTKDYVGRVGNVLITGVGVVIAVVGAMNMTNESFATGIPLDRNDIWGAAVITGGVAVTRLAAGLAGFALLARGKNVSAILTEFSMILAGGIGYLTIGIGVAGASWHAAIPAVLASIGLLFQDCAAALP